VSALVLKNERKTPLEITPGLRAKAIRPVREWKRGMLASMFLIEAGHPGGMLSGQLVS